MFKISWLQCLSCQWPGDEKKSNPRCPVMKWMISCLRYRMWRGDIHMIFCLNIYVKSWTTLNLVLTYILIDQSSTGNFLHWSIKTFEINMLIKFKDIIKLRSWLEFMRWVSKLISITHAINFKMKFQKVSFQFNFMPENW